MIGMNSDESAVTRQCPRYRAANALAGARDQGNFAIQSSHGMPPSRNNSQLAEGRTIFQRLESQRGIL